jgi:hypothetical protein
VKHSDGPTQHGPARKACDTSQSRVSCFAVYSYSYVNYIYSYCFLQPLRILTHDTSTPEALGRLGCLLEHSHLFFWNYTVVSCLRHTPICRDFPAINRPALDLGCSIFNATSCFCCVLIRSSLRPYQRTRIRPAATLRTVVSDLII